MRSQEIEDLALIRRLDWRFLLSDPGLGQVVYLGPRKGELRRALRRFTGSLVEDPESATMVGPFEVAVVASNRIADVRRAATLLKPGGSLYWEVDRRRSPLGPVGFLTDPRNALAPLDLTDVRAHWHYPNLESARMILPPTPVAIDYALRRRSASRSVPARLLVRTLPWRMLPRLVPSLSILARRPGGTEEAEEASAPPATTTLTGFDGPEKPPPYVLLTPRFRASRHVITAFLDPENGDAVSVAKTVRFPGDPSSVTREALAIQAAAALLPDPCSVPRFHALGSCGEGTPEIEPSGDGEGRRIDPDGGSRLTLRVIPQEGVADILGERTSERQRRSANGAASAPTEESTWPISLRGGTILTGPRSRDCGHPTLIASAVDGRLLTPADFRKDPQEFTRAVSAWVTTLHGATRIPIAEGVRMEWIGAFLRQIEQQGAFGKEGTALLERTLALVRPLVGSNLPAVLEHGDVSCPNILLSKTRRVGIVDWERADLMGMPGCDLFFFLAFVAVSREKSHNTAQALLAFRNAFFVKEGWALRHIERYWRDMQLPASAVAPLFVLCWARRAARQSGLSGRYMQFWLEACARAGEMKQKMLELL